MPTTAQPDGRARVALVTGGSSGIGRSCAEELVAAGWRVYSASRSASSVEGSHHVSMDVTDDASVTVAVAEVLRREGRIDAAVLSAGISVCGPCADVPTDDAQRQFDANYFGVVRSIRAVLPAMERQGSGRIIVIGSIGGLIALPYLGHYSATKFALDGLVEALRHEIRPLGVEATIVHPGDFNTALRSNRTYSATSGTASSYASRFSSQVAFYETTEKGSPPPTAVGRRIVRLLSRRRLPVKSVIGSPLELIGVHAKALLPAWLFERVFNLAYSSR